MIILAVILFSLLLLCFHISHYCDKICFKLFKYIYINLEKGKKCLFTMIFVYTTIDKNIIILN